MTNKNIATKQSVKVFLDGLDPECRKDCRTLSKMMRAATGKKAVMWGDAMVGFGQYHYKYASGREGDYFLTGFSPRKSNLSIYIMSGFDTFKKELKQLGKHKHSVSCLYVKNLDDIDLDVLQTMIEQSVAIMRERYPG